MPSDKPIVHVIDDDEAVRQALAFQLGSAGIDVQTYESAAAFLEVAPTVQVGCIITDVRMPELSGIDLLRRLIKSPVVLTAGCAEFSDAFPSGMPRPVFLLLHPLPRSLKRPVHRIGASDVGPRSTVRHRIVDPHWAVVSPDRMRGEATLMGGVKRRNFPDSNRRNFLKGAGLVSAAASARRLASE
jgi:CheY-like chemotaxis protein